MAEKIDQATEKIDSFTELIQELDEYLNTADISIKSRLALERKLRKFQEQNSADWLLNLIVSLDKVRHGKNNGKQAQST